MAVKDGGPVFSDEWHWNKPESKKDHARHFTPPVLPSVMRKCVMRDGGDYAGVLKDFLSTQAGKHQWWFKKAALGIIGAHVAATVCAATGLAFKAQFEGMLRVLLGVEFLLLVIGLCWHLWLHRSQSAKRWATARLVSEVARSVNAMAHVPGDLGHLFALPLPEFLRPLLHTLNVFHLETTRTLESGMWSDRRDAYVHNRLTRPDGGQIAYYAKQRRKAGSRHRFANFVFYLGGATALAATLVELLIECDCTFPGFPGWILDSLTRHHAFFEHLPGFLAIILPVLSVAALSLAASFDLEARKHTYEEMLRALEQHEEFIRGAKSEHEFVALVLQTEMRLLGENVNWFSRRVFTGVT